MANRRDAVAAARDDAYDLDRDFIEPLLSGAAERDRFAENADRAANDRDHTVPPVEVNADSPVQAARDRRLAASDRARAREDRELAAADRADFTDLLETAAHRRAAAGNDRMSSAVDRMDAANDRCEAADDRCEAADDDVLAYLPPFEQR